MLIVLGEHLNRPLQSLKGLGGLEVVGVAVAVLADVGTAVGEDGRGGHVALVNGQTEDIVGTVIVGVSLALAHELVELVPGPGAVRLHVIQRLGIDTRILQDLLVEVHTGTGLGGAGVHGKDLAALGILLMQLVGRELVAGEVQAVQSGQVIHQALCHSGGDGRIVTKRPDIVHIIAAGGAVVDEIGRRAAPVGNGLLGDLEVVGLLRPVTILLLSLLITGGRIGRIAGPPVADDDFHAAQIDRVAGIVRDHGVGRDFLFLDGSFFLNLLGLGSFLLGLGGSGSGLRRSCRCRRLSAAAGCKAHGHGRRGDSCDDFFGHKLFHLFSSSFMDWRYYDVRKSDDRINYITIFRYFNR